MGGAIAIRVAARLGVAGVVAISPAPMRVAQGVSAEQYAGRALEHFLKSGSGPRRHISEVIRENMRDIPAEVLAQLPSDGASEHDHYIYGLPKRNQ